jgi:putative membrane protein
VTVDAPLVEVPWRRLSSRMLLIHPIREVGRTAPGLIAILFAGSSGGHFHWWSLIAVVLVIAFSILHWFTTRYQITAEQVQLRSGLFRRRTITTPADRVRTVDVTAHALHRALGLARVSIGTGISDRKRDGLVLDGLTADEAGRLRAELLHRAGAPIAQWTPAGTPAVASPLEEQVASLDPSWLRYAPFTLSGAVTALAILGFAWRIVDQAHVNAGNVSAIRSTADQLRDHPVWLDIAEVTAGVLIVIALLSVLGYLLSFWNFKLTRHPGGTLHVSRGLITTRATSIEERRLRGIEVSELLPLRLVGGARLIAIATGLRVGRGSERGGTLLLPPCPLPEAQRVAGAVLPGSDRLVIAPVHGHGAIARRRRLVRALGPALAGFLAFVLLWWAGAVPGWLAVLSVLLPVLALPLALDRYRSLGHALAGGYLISQFGSLTRRRVLLHTDGVIGWNLRESFFQRRMGVLTLTATTAAGRQGYRITDLDVASALGLADAALPELLTEFLRR